MHQQYIILFTFKILVVLWLICDLVLVESKEKTKRDIHRIILKSRRAPRSHHSPRNHHHNHHNHEHKDNDHRHGHHKHHNHDDSDESDHSYEDNSRYHSNEDTSTYKSSREHHHHHHHKPKKEFLPNFEFNSEANQLPLNWTPFIDTTFDKKPLRHYGSSSHQNSRRQRRKPHSFSTKLPRYHHHPHQAPLPSQIDLTTVYPQKLPYQSLFETDDFSPLQLGHQQSFNNFNQKTIDLNHQQPLLGQANQVHQVAHQGFDYGVIKDSNSNRNNYEVNERVKDDFRPNEQQTYHHQGIAPSLIRDGDKLMGEGSEVKEVVAVATTTPSISEIAVRNATNKAPPHIRGRGRRIKINRN